jgi:hypothetical protein
MGMSKSRTGIHLDSLLSPEISEADVRKAQLTVASNSMGVDDCAELLDMLGLRNSETHD